MRQYTYHNVWVFNGLESTCTVFNSKQLNDAFWYIGHEPGRAIVDGPYPTEEEAFRNATAFINQLQPIMGS